jgi:hypothetical protein
MIFTEPKSGVPFTTETFSPTHANTVVDNERAAWWIAVQRRRTNTMTNTQDASVDLDLYWSPTAGRLLGAINTGASDNVAVFYSTCGSATDQSVAHNVTSKFIGAYEVLASYRLEQWPTTAAGGTTMWHTTRAGGDWGTTWSTTTIPNFCATGRPVWVGGPNNVRIVPGRYSATATETCLMYVAGTSTYTRHDLAFGNAPERIAHNGGGLVVACSRTHVWVGGNYGATLGDWTDVSYPTLASGSTTGRASIAYDPTRDIFVMVRSRTDYLICFATSNDGVSWSDWRYLGLANNAPTLVDVTCVNGAWLVQILDVDPFAYVTTRIWGSIDAGASWADFGTIDPGSSISPVTATKMTLIPCGNYAVSFRHTSIFDFSISELGPIDSPVLVAAAALP